MKLIKNLIILTLFVQFCLFLLPTKPSKVWGKFDRDGQLTTKIDNGDVCPDGYAIRIPTGEHFAGGYIKCEDYNPYYAALFENKIAEAEKLLLSYPPTYYDKKTRTLASKEGLSKQ